MSDCNSISQGKRKSKIQTILHRKRSHEIPFLPKLSWCHEIPCPKRYQSDDQIQIMRANNARCKQYNGVFKAIWGTDQITSCSGEKMITSQSTTNPRRRNALTSKEFLKLSITDDQWIRWILENIQNLESVKQ